MFPGIYLHDPNTDKIELSVNRLIDLLQNSLNVSATYVTHGWTVDWVDKEVEVDLGRVVGVDLMVEVGEMTGVHQGMEVGVPQSMKVHQGIEVGVPQSMKVHQGMEVGVPQLMKVHQGMEAGLAQSMKVHWGMLAGDCWSLEIGAHHGKEIGQDIFQGLANFFVVLVEHPCLVVAVVVAPVVAVLVVVVLQGHCSMCL